MIYLSKVERLPRPEIDMEDDKHPLVRGIRIHNEAEAFVRGDIPMTPDLKRFEDQFDDLRGAFAEGRVIVEKDWGFDINWGECDWNDYDNIWTRLKLDALEWVDKHTARVIDYKTGKKYMNEVKHMMQAQLYALGTFMRYPQVDLVQTEFWYLDQASDNFTKKVYHRKQMAKYLAIWNKRGLAMTSALDFPPKPSKYACMWCDYGDNKGTSACNFCYEE